MGSTVDGGDILSKGKRPGIEGALLHMIGPYPKGGCLFLFCSMQHTAQSECADQTEQTDNVVMQYCTNPYLQGASGREAMIVTRSDFLIASRLNGFLRGCIVPDIKSDPFDPCVCTIANTSILPSWKINIRWLQAVKGLVIPTFLRDLCGRGLDCLSIASCTIDPDLPCAISE